MNGKDRLFLETDDTCAICSHPDRRHLTVHHLDGNPANNTYDNRIVLCWNCHQAHNQGHEPTDDQIRDRKRTLIARTLTDQGISALKQAVRRSEGVVALPFLVYHLVELGYLDEQECQMGYGGIDVTVRYTATPEGERLVRAWSL
jgi:hypothetical protein